MGENSDIFLGTLFIIMCITSIKNIGDIIQEIEIIFITKQIIF